MQAVARAGPGRARAPLAPRQPHVRAVRPWWQQHAAGTTGTRHRTPLGVRAAAVPQQKDEQQRQQHLQPSPRSTAGLVLTELAPARAPAVLRLGSGGGSTAGSRSLDAPLPQQQQEQQQGAPAPAAAPGPLAALKALYLPEGFPASVTGDYL
jgi:hypothetical protein